MPQKKREWWCPGNTNRDFRARDKVYSVLFRAGRLELLCKTNLQTFVSDDFDLQGILGFYLVRRIFRSNGRCEKECVKTEYQRLYKATLEDVLERIAVVAVVAGEVVEMSMPRRLEWC